MENYASPFFPGLREDKTTNRREVRGLQLRFRKISAIRKGMRVFEQHRSRIINNPALRSIFIATCALSCSFAVLPQTAPAQRMAPAPGGAKGVGPSNVDIRVNSQGPTTALIRSSATSLRAQTQSAGIARGVARAEKSVAQRFQNHRFGYRRSHEFYCGRVDLRSQLHLSGHRRARNWKWRFIHFHCSKQCNLRPIVELYYNADELVR